MYEELTQKILNQESPGMRSATLVDACHIAEGDHVVSLVVFDKSPTRFEDQVEYVRRWAVVISKMGDGIEIPLNKAGGIVTTRWEAVE